MTYLTKPSEQAGLHEVNNEHITLIHNHSHLPLAGCTMYT